MSAPARSMAPDDGFDEVAVTGRVGGDGPAGADLDGTDLDGTDLDCKDLDGSDLDVCFVVDLSDLPTASAEGAFCEPDLSAELGALAFAGLVDLFAELALRSSRALSTEPGGFVGLSALFAGLSDLRSPWAGLSGFCADCGCVGVLSESDAACAAAAPSAIAATMKHVSRNAFTDTDLSVAARYLQPSSTRKD
jgi:hypothetical protein